MYLGHLVHSVPTQTILDYMMQIYSFTCLAGNYFNPVLSYVFLINYFFCALYYKVLTCINLECYYHKIYFQAQCTTHRWFKCFVDNMADCPVCRGNTETGKQPTALLSPPCECSVHHNTANKQLHCHHCCCSRTLVGAVVQTTGNTQEEL